MSKKTDKEHDKKFNNKNKFEGIPMSEKSLKEYEQTWIDMKECFEYLDKQVKNIRK